MNSDTTEKANKEVTTINVSIGSKRKPYLKLTDEQRATIGHYAMEHGTVNAIRHFKGDFPQDSLGKVLFMGGIKPIYRNFNHVEERGRQSGKRIAEKKKGPSINDGGKL